MSFKCKNKQKNISQDFQIAPLEEELSNFNVFKFYLNGHSRDDPCRVSLDFRMLINENILTQLKKIAEESQNQRNFEDYFLSQGLSYFIQNSFTLSLLRLLRLKKAKEYYKALETIDFILLKKPNEVYLLLEKKRIFEILNKTNESEKLQAKIDSLIKHNIDNISYSKSLKALHLIIEDDFEAALSIFDEAVLSAFGKSYFAYYRIFCILVLSNYQESLYLCYVNNISNKLDAMENYDEIFEILKELIGNLVLNRRYEYALKWLNFTIDKNFFTYLKNKLELKVLEFYCLLLCKNFNQAYENLIHLLNTETIVYGLDLNFKLQLEKYLNKEIILNDKTIGNDNKSNSCFEDCNPPISCCMNDDEIYQEEKINNINNNPVYAITGPNVSPSQIFNIQENTSGQSEDEKR